MNELRNINPAELSNYRPSHTLAAVDEAAISCANLEDLNYQITHPDNPILLMMLASQVAKGTRGHAKAQILTSLTPEIVAFMSVSASQMQYEINSAWKSVIVPRPLLYEQRELIAFPNRVSQAPNFPTTNAPQDYYWMEEAKRQIDQSNCWLDPAGCAFVRGEELLIKSRSTRFNRCDCQKIPFHFHDLHLNTGERMMFCDAQHAERQGVSQASLQRISLENSTLYVNKFPCRPCILSILGAGIREVVYEKDSYGLPDAQLLWDNQVTIKRLIPRELPE